MLPAMSEDEEIPDHIQKLRGIKPSLPCKGEPKATIYTDFSHGAFEKREGMTAAATFHAPAPVVSALQARFEKHEEDAGIKIKPLKKLIMIVEAAIEEGECPYCDDHLDVFIDVPYYKVRAERRNVRLCYGTKPARGKATGPVKLAAYGVDTVALACGVSERTVRRWVKEEDFNLYDLVAVARRIGQYRG